MKRIFTLCFFLSGIMLASAQTLTFYNGETPIVSGSEVVSMRYDEIYASLPGLEALKFLPEISLVSDGDAAVRVMLKALDGQEIAICAGGDCVYTSAPDWTQTKNIALVANTPLDMEIDYNAGKGTFGKIVTARAEVAAWYEGNEDSKISFTLVMTSDPALGGVPTVQAVAPTVRAEGANLVYSLAGADAASLAVYSIGGAAVFTCTLADAEGCLSLSTLPAGLYIYRLTAAGAPVCGKIVIRQ